MKQLTWLRIIHSEDWCLRLALHTHSGACQKYMNEWMIDFTMKCMTAAGVLMGGILKILSWAYLKYSQFIWWTDSISQLQLLQQILHIWSGSGAVEHHLLYVEHLPAWWVAQFGKLACWIWWKNLPRLKSVVLNNHQQQNHNVFLYSIQMSVATIIRRYHTINV